MTLDVDVLELLIPNILTVLTQLCATLILFWALKKFAWKPVKNMLDQREAYEQGLITDAEKLKQENEELKVQLENKLEAADKQVEITIADAEKEGQRIRESLVEEGKERSKQLVANAEQEVAIQKEKMLNEMQADIVNVTIEATSKLLNEKLNADNDKEAVESFVKEVAKK